MSDFEQLEFDLGIAPEEPWAPRCISEMGGAPFPGDLSDWVCPSCATKGRPSTLYHAESVHWSIGDLCPLFRFPLGVDFVPAHLDVACRVCRLGFACDLATDLPGVLDG